MDPEAVIENARGDVDEGLLTRTDGGLVGRNVLADAPLLAYLDPGERLQYLLSGAASPVRVVRGERDALEQEGSYRTLLAVTDGRLLVVAGSRSGDRSLSFPYDSVAAVECDPGLLTDTVTVRESADRHWEVPVRSGSDPAEAVAYAAERVGGRGAADAHEPVTFDDPPRDAAGKGRGRDAARAPSATDVPADDAEHGDPAADPGETPPVEPGDDEDWSGPDDDGRGEVDPLDPAFHDVQLTDVDVGDAASHRERDHGDADADGDRGGGDWWVDPGALDAGRDAEPGGTERDAGPGGAGNEGEPRGGGTDAGPRGRGRAPGPQDSRRDSEQTEAAADAGSRAGGTEAGPDGAGSGTGPQGTGREPGADSGPSGSGTGETPDLPPPPTDESDLVTALFEHVVAEVAPSIRGGRDVEEVIAALRRYDRQLHDHLEAGDLDGARRAAATVDGLAERTRRLADERGRAALAERAASVRVDVRRTVVAASLGVDLQDDLDGAFGPALKEVLVLIDPDGFEHVVADLWAALGYRTTVTDASGDRGIDVVARRSSPVEQTVLVQAKRYGPETTVGSEEIQQYASLHRQEPGADLVVVVTTGSFTEPARELARDLNVKLVDGDRLVELLVDAGLQDAVAGYLR